MKIIIYKIGKLLKQMLQNFRYFWIPWLLLLAMLGVSFYKRFDWLYIVMGIFVFALIWKPRHFIYGLIGTRGTIRMFFIYFIIINFLFSGVYYFSFFQNAGITYETNQPHVEFDVDEFHESNDTETTSIKFHESIPPTSKDTVGKDTVHTYYRITYPWVLRNTFLTSLMQEPSDFFSICSTFTGKEQSTNDPNYAWSRCFHWFLIFHILISWILLGVFISLLYSKFRNES